MKQARKLPFVDPNRLGILGGSHGGHVTSRLISRVDARGAVLYAPAALDLIEVKKAAGLLEGLGKDVPRAVHLRLARYLDALERAEEAEGRRELARKAVPARAIDWFLSAQERIQAGDRRGARADLRRALVVSENMFWAHFLLGRLQRKVVLYL